MTVAMPTTRPDVGQWPEDFLTQKEVADQFGMKPATVRLWMRGHKGKPPFPYIRLGRSVWFSRPQIAWWMQQVQEQVDPVMVVVRRATKEQT